LFFHWRYDAARRNQVGDNRPFADKSGYAKIRFLKRHLVEMPEDKPAAGKDWRSVSSEQPDIRRLVRDA
jgi:hypothetical protein